MLNPPVKICFSKVKVMTDLFQAILCFAMLVYIHLAFARHPVKCLEEVKETWPRDGILRVEIMKEAPDNYGIDASYEKERNLQAIHRNQEEIPSVFGFLDLGYVLLKSYN